MGDGFPFDILFLGLVAAFLILQLRRVLGRRTGHEKPPPDIFSRSTADEEEKEGNVIQLPEGDYEPINDVEPSADDAAKEESPRRTDDEEVIAGLKEIQAANKNFDAADFLQGASAAFEMIIETFAVGDKSTLRPLLSDDVYDDFTSAIKAREDSGEILENSLVGLKKVEILEAGLDGRIATLTVKFVSEQISVTCDAEGKVIDGDPEHIVQMIDIWTFSRNLRSRDPNWTLVETRSQN
ncbi:MAG TPA: translocase [Rhodospirillaceae bacterium]|nr:Tim44/TimA family putative adaptor protein [Alphaproteobacteria bacterium]MDP6780896.1 Tim44/TimA family putative adaptor protein [Alphaproteobacteria bacterium]HAQ32930.1 translocase [Rhodospirillaceae bacterium]